MPAVPFTLDVQTSLCIVFALSFMPAAYVLSSWLIPSTQKRNKALFFWHAYDALTHLFIEGSFLYESFTSFAEIPIGLKREPHFLSQQNRVYGAAYGKGPTARLWQEYAKADRRWGTADTTVVSLELLTVLLCGPVAIYICYLIWKSSSDRVAAPAKGAAKGKLWLAAPSLAIAELYGGFMTFAPEWLTGSSQLETRNPVYLWFYLFFFNTLWVFIPIWVLWEASKELSRAFARAEGGSRERKNQ